MKFRAGIFVLAAAIYAGPAFAQTQTPPPAAPAPQTAPAPPAPVPFPEGAKVAYVDFQRVASESELGKAAAGRINDFIKKKQAEGQEKGKQLQAMLERQKTQASVLSDAAMKQLEQDIAKAQRDLQYFQNEAQAEQETLNNELMREFQEKVLPIVQALATERGLHMVFDFGSFVFANRGLDLTPEIITRANATLKK
ncbi:MAG TPA: OmpH family outer membrane protein [Vicinamibacterales bacterium]|nr:OmpH family outer membrane protein [Vicinamibacterales bacterium]